MKFIDICAGIGGFRSGLELAGHECIGYVEIDKFARLSYQNMYDTENEWTATDITKIEPSEIPKADLWCFGFPCQDISVAGKMKGLNGKRSGIFYSIIELIKGKSAEDRPKWLLIENVKNLLSLNGGREFTEVLSEISEAGYDAEWHLVNSKDHGVPQNRERVFIVGHLRDGGGQQVLPLTGASGQACCQRQKEQKIKAIKAILDDKKHQTNKVYSIDGISRTLIAGEGGGIGNGLKTGLYAVPKINVMAEGSHETDTVVSKEGLSKTLKATDYKNPVRVAVPKVRAVYSPSFSKMGQQGPRIKEEGEPMFTVTSFSPHGVAVPKQIIPGDQAHRVYDSNGVSVTIKAEGGGVGAKTGLYIVPKIKTIATGSNQRKSVQANDGIARALTATDYKEPQPVAIPKVKSINTPLHNGNYVQSAEGLSRTVLSRDYKDPQKVAIPCLTPDRLNKRQNGRRFKDIEDPMFTLTAQDRHGVLIYKDEEYYIRRLTPKECFRLQGFTDKQFEKAQSVNSNSQLYKQAGNAVTVNVAYLIGKYLKEME